MSLLSLGHRIVYCVQVYARLGILHILLCHTIGDII